MKKQIINEEKEIHVSLTASGEKHQNQNKACIEKCHKSKLESLLQKFELSLRSGNTQSQKHYVEKLFHCRQAIRASLGGIRLSYKEHVESMQHFAESHGLRFDASLREPCYHKK